MFGTSIRRYAHRPVLCFCACRMETCFVFFKFCSPYLRATSIGMSYQPSRMDHDRAKFISVIKKNPQQHVNMFGLCPSLTFILLTFYDVQSRMNRAKRSRQFCQAPPARASPTSTPPPPALGGIRRHVVSLRPAREVFGQAGSIRLDSTDGSLFDQGCTQRTS